MKELDNAVRSAVLEMNIPPFKSIRTMNVRELFPLARTAYEEVWPNLAINPTNFFYDVRNRGICGNVFFPAGRYESCQLHGVV